ncbi:MAG: hypothetical protein H7Y88_07215 [Phycisphaerales bacterium]|nr:hypothetical protein [Phycisphaerales bacterium]
MKVLIADQFEQSGRDGLAALGDHIAFEPGLTPESLADAVATLDPTVLVVRSKKVKPPAIAAGKSLKLIIRAGAGYDNIDLAAASQRGIAVCNCPGMNTVAVAELVFGLLICCDRRIPDQTAELRAGAWNKKEYSRARGLKGLTLGVIGVGSIGREVVKRAQAFGMSCIAHSLNMNTERARDLGVTYGGSSNADMLSVVGRCDAVSVHVAANRQSEKMCGTAFFGAMKPGAYFINTSRGSVVDEAALANAVTSKGIRAGLDVFEDEPAEDKVAYSTKLASLPGVYTTHHVGASTDQAQNAVAEEVVRIVKVYRSSGEFENRVN